MGTMVSEIKGKYHEYQKTFSFRNVFYRGEVLKVLTFCFCFRLANSQEYEMETLSTPCATSTTTSCANIPGQQQHDEITYEAVPGDDLPPVQEEENVYEEIPAAKRDACLGSACY